MYYSITGKVSRVDDNVLVVNAGGVGYEVFCSTSSIYELLGESEKTVYTYLHVREDAFMLFGFSSLAEKKMFMNLISISGIGPKMAISILSGVSSNMLARAVVNKDVSMLTKIKGLGKKTAERIVLELKEKVEENVKQNVSNGFDGFESAAVEVSLSREMADAIQVLIELGIKKEDAIKLVKAKASDGDKVEDIVKKCL